MMETNTLAYQAKEYTTMTLIITTFSIMTIRIKGLLGTLSIATLSAKMLSVAFY